uniref:4-diphosphocytidyl-2-C-methyl-D-erythritol kinase n=1 Tax=uncultured Thiotrichaceae bacterium TaxID=298394 RepID=A0A6S6UM00_9GAMM|nr:MAG: 4-diphosphocytidyl-2-C-methyl-D-erythritol kinase (EC [uncultured Thiotrichaceae bacterium]
MIPDHKTLKLPAPAKINHFLHITGRRADGYHLLQTLFQFLDYSDDIELTLRGDGIISRSEGHADIPVQDDLVVRAAQLLQIETACQFGVDIKVHKRLPMGGGLGGGSSDAATTLLGLNLLWGCGLSEKQLAALGLCLGADVPVFVYGKAAWAEGVGEQLEFMDLPSKWYLVVHPGVHISTAQIFSHEGLTRDVRPITIATFLAGQTQNVFETVAKKVFSEVGNAYNWLSDFAVTKMTGSGACLFAEFESEFQAQQVLNKLPKQWTGFIARSDSRSPLHKKLDNIAEVV